MSNVLDDLFTWAAQQPTSGYETSVKIDITSNEITRNNLVTYATGKLIYHRSQSAGMRYLPAYFSSGKDKITQYFSDRGNNPFDHSQTDPLTVTINKQFIASVGYTITIESSKWNFHFSFTPTIDPSTQILYGTDHNTFITISLCGRESHMIPK